MVFDVPSLVSHVGRDIAEMTTALGTPDVNTEPPATYTEHSEIREWEKTWEKEGYALTATYNIDTKKVTELFLGSDRDATLVVFRDRNNILKVGNLSITSQEYSVEFVKLRAVLGAPKENTPEGYTGAIIRKK